MIRTRRALLVTIPHALAASLLLGPALAQSPLSASDFAKQVAVANMFGVESATLALQKTSAPAIKDYAHRLADDHAKAASSLRRVIARRSDIALPDRPDSRHLDTLRDLGALQGGDFDKAYVEAQRSAHQQLAQLLESYAHDGGDPELKAFATETLPLFQELDRKARELAPAP
jgi:putative membrane protein